MMINSLTKRLATITDEICWTKAKPVQTRTTVKTWARAK
jgi:hypothetical protein